jgi:hypothetical protein
MASKLNTTPDWHSASGMRIEGAYELCELVSADGGSAIFRALLPGDLAPRGLARLFRLNAIAAARQRDLWQAVASHPHQNLQRIFGAAVTEIGGDLVACVVTEGADENLAVELVERSLTADEAGGLFQSLAPALDHLHTAGFVHGRVCPGEMFASGDTIKISCDCATRAGQKVIADRGSPTYLAPEQTDENTTAAADIWCFGASLFEALTQSRFSLARLEEAHQLPAPFGRIIADCLDPNPDARPRLTEILSMYQGNDVPTTPAKAQPPVVELKDAPVNVFGAEQAEPRRRSRLLPFLIALPVLLVVFFLWPAKNKTAARRPVTSPDAKGIVGQIAPAAASVPAIPQTAPPERPSSGGSTPKPEPRATNGQVWRVVLWTYRNRSDAQEKVDYVAAQFPALHPEVFTPDTNPGMYLVVAGGEMTREQAENTERTARQLGLPRDTYIQSYRH